MITYFADALERYLMLIFDLTNCHVMPAHQPFDHVSTELHVFIGVLQRIETDTFSGICGSTQRSSLPTSSALARYRLRSHPLARIPRYPQTCRERTWPQPKSIYQQDLQLQPCHLQQ